MASYPATMRLGKSRNPSIQGTSIAEAKAKFSAIVKAVEHDGTEVTVLRRGVAVARIVPVSKSEPVCGYGWMRGSAHILGDIIGPSGEEWDAPGDH